MLDLDSVLEQFVAELVARGARAVALLGSHARNMAHQLSDIDLYAIGDGPDYETRRLGGVLVTVAWRTQKQVAESFFTPPACVQAVPAWRSARVLTDPTDVVARLVSAADAWSWDDVPDPDRWCASELPGYAEEVQKLRAARLCNDPVSAALWRNVLAMRLAKILAVHFRVLAAREEEIWPRVAAEMGDAWGTAQRTALGLDAPGFEATCHAALDLYRFSLAELRPSMTPEQAAVAEGALGEP